MSDMDYACRIRNARCIIDARPPQFMAAKFRLSKISDAKKWLRRVDEENAYLGKRLLCMKSTMNTRTAKKVTTVSGTTHDQEQQRREMFQKYKQILPLVNPRAIPLLLWPKVYLDMGVSHVRPLDRLVIVLYTEAAPNVVLSWVKMSKSDENRRLSFHRIYPNLWMEGTLEMPEGRQVGVTNRTVNDHNQAGTLSLLERKGSPGVVQFSVSFKPLNVLNGQRVAFGRVVEGLKILASLQDYGTKNGKTKKEIVVLGCGLMR